jgi:hypothetical protein
LQTRAALIAGSEPGDDGSALETVCDQREYALATLSQRSRQCKIQADRVETLFRIARAANLPVFRRAAFALAPTAVFVTQFDR